jgi:hypothetical protein
MMPDRETMTTGRVNNDVYRRMGHAWWDDDVGEFSTIRFFDASYTGYATKRVG